MARHRGFPGLLLPCLDCGLRDGCECALGTVCVETVSRVRSLLLDIVVWVDRAGDVDVYATASDLAELPLRDRALAEAHLERLLHTGG